MNNGMIRTSLNRSKLTRPRSGAYVVRRLHLEASLAAAQGLALVIAPAGYGKTTLASSWLEHEVLPSTWLSLDERDNNLVAFVAYLVAAVRVLFPDACAATLALLEGINVPPSDAISQTLLHELALLEQEFVLVLDDYHFIHERTIHAIVTELTRHLPPALRLVILARKDPALPLARLRARGDVVELREANLRFSPEETANFLRKEMQFQVDDQTITDLNASTEGWVTGLRLTALFVQHTGDLKRLTNFLQSQNRYITGYLVAEVLEKVPDAIKEFLLKTAILEEFCGPLCEAVTGNTDPETGSQMCLAWLESNNLFLYSIDEERHWYRYHHLFRRLLLDQLGQQYDRPAINALHAQASAWFAREGFVEHALRHALASGETAAAVRVFADHRCELVNSEQWHRLEQWLNLFPRAVIDAEPELLLSEIWLQLNRRKLADLKRSLDQVETLLTQQPPDGMSTDRLWGEVENRRASQYYFAGAYEQSMAAALRSLELLPPAWWILRAQARLYLSVCYQVAGKLQQGYAVLYEADEPGFGRTQRMRYALNACFMHWMAADLPGMLHAAGQILSKGESADLGLETITWAHYHRGVAHYQRNELAAAQRDLMQLVAQPHLPHVACFLNGAAAMAFIYQAQDEPEKANELAESMLAYVLENGSTDALQTMWAFQADLAHRQGRHAEVDYRTGQVAIILQRPLPLFIRPPLILARTLVLQNTTESRHQAGEILRALYEYFTSIHTVSVVIEVLALQALLCQSEGDERGAQTALQQALDLAAPGSVIRIFVDLGAPIQRLLAELVQAPSSNGTVSAFAARILSAFPQPISPAPDPRQSNAALLSPLTPRELEVLVLLEQRYTDHEIAKTLVISPDTVHSHVQHIGDKLAVRGRRAIVQAAREHGILA